MISNYKRMIGDIANVFDIKPEIVYGIIMQESNFNLWAVRYEPAKQECSYGLMQLMLSTARWLLNKFLRNVYYFSDHDHLLEQIRKFQDKFLGDEMVKGSTLFDPQINIFLGCLYLWRQLKRYNWNYEKAISAYNAGSYTPNNSRYVKNVLQYSSEYHGDQRRTT